MTNQPFGERTDEILELAEQLRTTALRNLALMEADDRQTFGAEREPSPADGEELATDDPAPGETRRQRRRAQASGS